MTTAEPFANFAQCLADNGLSVAVFFSDYWQKKPLLLKGLANGWNAHIDADTLAGLAMEESLDSRLIDCTAPSKDSVRNSSNNSDSDPTQWQVTHGPLTEADFNGRGPDQPWTFLVHGVEQALPEVHSTLDFWSAFPGWRMNDVMMSFSTTGAGVGPHYDEYDVFLLQIEGKRQWRLGDFCDTNTPLQAHPQLRLLANMGVGSEWIVEPGDALYVPAKMAHDGVALDTSITWSMGFRAPSWQDSLADFTDYILDNNLATARYQDDADLLSKTVDQHQPGLITDSTVETFRSHMAECILQSPQFVDWLGGFLSQGKPNQDAESHDDNEPPLELDDAWNDILNPNAPDLAALASVTFLRDEHTRFAYVDDPDFKCFANGEALHCPTEATELAKCLTNHHQVAWSAMPDCRNQPESIEFIHQLLKKGLVYTIE